MRQFDSEAKQSADCASSAVHVCYLLVAGGFPHCLQYKVDLVKVNRQILMSSKRYSARAGSRTGYSIGVRCGWRELGAVVGTRVRDAQCPPCFKAQGTVRDGCRAGYAGEFEFLIECERGHD